MRKNIMLAVAVAAALSACSTAQTTLISACDAYGTTLDRLAFYREQGRLSPSTIATVNKILPEAHALCSGPLPTDEDSAISKVNDLTAQLAAVLTEVK